MVSTCKQQYARWEKQTKNANVAEIKIIEANKTREIAEDISKMPQSTIIVNLEKWRNVT